MAAAPIAPSRARVCAPCPPPVRPPASVLRRRLLLWPPVVAAVVGSTVLVVAFFFTIPRRQGPNAQAVDAPIAALTPDQARWDEALTPNPALRPPAKAPAATPGNSPATSQGDANSRKLPPATNPPDGDKSQFTSLSGVGGDKAPSCGQYGTQVNFFDSPAQATAQAITEQKLVFVLHVAGNFEEPGFT
jgi:hypothetical protein